MFSCFELGKIADAHLRSLCYYVSTGGKAVDTHLEEGTYGQPIPPPPMVVATGDEHQQEEEDATKFDTGKAARYSVANLGAAVVYGLFNLAMPEYLKSYGVPPWLIGPLANERSLVGAFVQPFVGRLFQIHPRNFGLGGESPSRSMAAAKSKAP